MKKISVLFVLALISLAGFAQVSKAGSFGTEIYFNPWNNGGATFSLIDGAKVRYFVSDKMAIRTTLNFNMASPKSYVYRNNGTKDVEFKGKASVINFGIAPGIEYHFANFERISLYAGAEIALDLTKASLKTSNDENDDKIEIKGAIYDPAGGGNGIRNDFSFGINVFTGIDFYVYKSLYIGAELGLGYGMSKESEITVKTTTGSNSTETKYKDYDSAGGFGFFCLPAVRIGWTF